MTLDLTTALVGIATCDAQLTVASQRWLDAPDAAQKRNGANLLDCLLDCRLVFMASRDAAQPSTTPTR